MEMEGSTTTVMDFVTFPTLAVMMAEPAVRPVIVTLEPLDGVTDATLELEDSQLMVPEAPEGVMAARIVEVRAVPVSRRVPLFSLAPLTLEKDKPVGTTLEELEGML